MLMLREVTSENASDEVAQLYERIQEMFGDAPMPSMFLVYGNVEPFLRDFYMNFKKFVFTDGQLNEATKAAIALAVAGHAKCGPWTKWCAARCLALGVNTTQVAEVLAVGATNAMYNTFFKFRDLSGTTLFDGMGVGLRAHTFANVSLDPTLVELINIVISDINACKPCTSGHVEKGKKLGLSHEKMLEAIQCGATMYAGCQFLSAAEHCTSE